MHKKPIILILLLLLIGILAIFWAAATYVPGGHLLAVTQQLDHPDGVVRARAVAELRGMGTNVVPELLAILNDNEPEWRIFLRQQLPVKLRPSFRPRVQAMRGLEMLGPLAEPAVPAMIAQVDGRRFPRRAGAVLVAVGPAAVAPICRALQVNAAGAIQTQLINVLGEMGTNAGSAVPELLARVADARAEIRAAVAVALGKIRLQPDDAIPDLEKLLRDEMAEVRVAAAMGLGGFGPLANESVPALMAAVYDHHPAVRRAALNAVLRLDNPAAALEALLEMSGDKEQDNRSAILNELLKHEVPAEALTGLCTALKGDPDVTVRRQLPKLIKRLPPADRARLAGGLLHDGDQEIRITAGEMLGRSIADTASVQPAISRALRDCDYTTGLALLNGLARSGRLALPLFCEALTNGLPGIRRQAAFFLGTLKREGRPAVAALAKALDDSDHKVRVDALHALERIDPQLVPPLPEKNLSEAEEKELIAKTKAAVAKYAPH